MKPGDEPSPAVRAIHEKQLDSWELPDGEPGVGAARWPGHAIGDEDEVLQRLRDGIGEL